MKKWFHWNDVGSTLAICLVSLASALSVLGFAIFLQWLIYDDWMHVHAPMRWVGSLLAAGLGFFAVLRWQLGLRRRRLEMLRRFETIRWMNDRIRNSLQKIELLAYANSPATEAVSEAVDVIEDVLHEVLTEAYPDAGQDRPQPRQQKMAESQ